jgi:hypothetical protein
MGLDKTFQTGRIAIHPTDPNIVYVGAAGRLWGPSEERGLFKTTDGGQTWEKVLYIDDKTGVIDVQMHPDDPETLLVATYERQRDEFDTNAPAKKWGPGGGLYKTTNGGKTWLRLSKGLPTCELGRIGIDYYRKNPDIVYAVIESERIAEEPEDAPYMGIRGEDIEVGAKLTDIIAQRNKYIKMRQAGQYKDDLIVRKQIAPASHLNKMIPKFYTEFGEKPLSEVTEALLHTHYEPRIPTFPMEV